MDKIKVILDTDIGDDIDDAFALALVLNSPEIDLMGVTTVFRNAFKRAKMAKYIINTYKHDINVYAGIDEPFEQNVDELIIESVKVKERLDENGKYLIPQWQDEMKNGIVEEKSAVDFIIETVHKYPGEIVLMGIGPFTNIASALLKNPSIKDEIKEIRIMGGRVYPSYPGEWNVLCDPEAAKIVYNSGVKMSAIGVNVTENCTLDNDNIEALKNSNDKCKVIFELMLKWFIHYDNRTPTMHDPLSVATLIDPSIVDFNEGYVDVSLEKPKRGLTEIVNNGNKKIRVAKSFNKDKFLELFCGRIFNIK